jgi:hypothetical protein
MKIFKNLTIRSLLTVIIALSATGMLFSNQAFATSVGKQEVGSVSSSAVGRGMVDTVDITKAITTSTSSSLHEAVPFTIVYLPIKDWTEITAQRYPNLYRVLEGAAIGNLVANDTTISEQIAANSNINLYNLESLDSRAADAEIAKLLPNNLEQGVFVLVCSASFVRPETNSALTPVLVSEAGFSGYLTSSTTRRTGLITATDILYFEKQLNTIEDTVVTTPTQAASKTVFDLTGLQSNQLLKDKLAFLQHNIAVCNGIAVTIEPMNLVFLALFILTAIASLVLLFFEIDVNPRYLSILVPVSRGLLLIMISFPIACFLMFLIPPPLYGFANAPGGLISLCLLWTIILTTASLIIGSFSKWIYSLLFLLAITFTTLILDQLLGGPLTLTGYLNYSVVDGVRYYGLGNEAAAILFGSWITFSGVVVNRFGSSKVIPIFKRWLFLVLSTLVIFICAIPVIGASFGVLVWGVMGILIAWWLFSGRPINLKFLLITLTLSFILAMGTFIVDVNFNPYSHFADLLPYLQSDPLSVIGILANNVAHLSLATVTYSPILTLVFFGVLIWLVALATIKPGTYREFWAHNLGFRAVYAAGLVVILIMCALEDSGIYMPALYMVYLLAGFIWLVCDMHSWRVRASIKIGDHISVRDLMRMALEKETYESLGQGAAFGKQYQSKINADDQHELKDDVDD